MLIQSVLHVVTGDVHPGGSSPLNFLQHALVSVHDAADCSIILLELFQMGCNDSIEYVLISVTRLFQNAFGGFEYCLGVVTQEGIFVVVGKSHNIVSAANGCDFIHVLGVDECIINGRVRKVLLGKVTLLGNIAGDLLEQTLLDSAVLLQFQKLLDHVRYLPLRETGFDARNPGIRGFEGEIIINDLPRVIVVHIIVDFCQFIKTKGRRRLRNQLVNTPVPLGIGIILQVKVPSKPIEFVRFHTEFFIHLIEGSVNRGQFGNICIYLRCLLRRIFESWVIVLGDGKFHLLVEALLIARIVNHQRDMTEFAKPVLNDLQCNLLLGNHQYTPVLQDP